MNKVLLFNPRSARSKHRVPNSILQVGASIYGRWDFVLVDGNLEQDPWSTIQRYLDSGDFGYFGCTVMPGPQLRQAIPFTKRIKTQYPAVTTIWGGVPMSAVASTAHQAVLDLAPDAELAFAMEPPACQLLLWQEGEGMLTHVTPIGPFDGPYPFYEGGRLID